MSRTILCALTFATGLIPAPSRLSGQRPAQLLADARDQIRAQKLDSAITLLHAITTSGEADSSERAEAFVWLGVATFYQGHDSAVTYAFRDALGSNPLLTPASHLARLDSGLAALWEHEQTIVLCGESLPAWLWSLQPRQTLALNSDARTTRAEDCPNRLPSAGAYCPGSRCSSKRFAAPPCARTPFARSLSAIR